jgi:anti-sigma B factor antagonist
MDLHKSLYSVESMMGVQVVKLVPKQILDQLQISEIGQGLKDMIDQGTTKILLDFSNVDHLSSASLGMLITTKKQIEVNKGRFKLCSIKPPLLEVFKITRLDKVFSIYKNSDEALLSFA